MNKAQFWSYFNCADEIDGGLTLADLSRSIVEEARAAADTHGFPWPPDLAYAEEFVLDHSEELRA